MRQYGYLAVFCLFGIILVIVLLGIMSTFNSFIGAFTSSETALGEFFVFFLSFFKWTLAIASVLGCIWLGAKVYWALHKELTPSAEGNYPALVGPSKKNIITIAAGNGPVPNHLHYEVNAVQPKGMLAAPTLEPPPLELPGPCDLADILESWRPNPQEILLALGPGGQRITVPVKGLCHVALAGATGGGKSVLLRLLLAQLLFVNARVVLVDPHYTPVDFESGEDWRPIASKLAMDPAVSYADIKDTLNWIVRSELPKRLDARHNMQPLGAPYFLAMDELPAIVANVPEAPAQMATLLREGRKVGLYLVSAAQDWLVKTVGGSGGVRDCFRTAFYVGGDAQTARILLDVKGSVDDGGLGKGIVMLRSSATPKASLSRVPYASNHALMDLLSVPSTAYATADPTAPPPMEPLQTSPYKSTATVDTTLQSEEVLDARTLRIREMVRERISPSKIIEEIWGISSKQGGDAYKKAARELSDIMSSLV